MTGRLPPFEIGHWIVHTQALTAEQRGYYLDLLIWSWSHPEPLPDDAARLMAIARCRYAKRWRATWPTLLQYFEKQEGGWRDPKLEQLRAAYVAAKNAKRRAGEASALARAERRSVPLGVGQPLPAVPTPVVTPQPPPRPMVDAAAEPQRLPTRVFTRLAHDVLDDLARLGPQDETSVMEELKSRIAGAGLPYNSPAAARALEGARWQREHRAEPATPAPTGPLDADQPQPGAAPSDAAAWLLTRVLTAAGGSLDRETLNSRVYEAALIAWPDAGQEKRVGIVSWWDHVIGCCWNDDTIRAFPQRFALDVKKGVVSLR
jgi:uncharacterized protein YdaU (DUF1376 family)